MSEISAIYIGLMLFGIAVILMVLPTMMRKKRSRTK